MGALAARLPPDRATELDQFVTVSENLPLESLLASAPDGFLIVDGGGSILWANPMAERLFGYERGELTGKGVDQLVPDRLRSTHSADRGRFRSNPRVRPMGLGLDLLARKKDGTEFPVEISLSPVAGAETLLVTAIVRDVTQRKKLEEERGVLEIELETERERDRIAMDLHDGILQDIYASALTLELAVADEEDERFANAPAVERAINQLHDVVRDIRSYIFNLRPRQFSGNLADALTDLAREFHQNSQIDTSADISSRGAIELPKAVALFAIAHESLSNIQRHAKAKHVTISLRFKDGSGHLRIEDDGVGFKASRNLSEQHRGLRNMASRAQSIDAKLKIDSTPGKGTRLSVVFPLTPER